MSDSLFLFSYLVLWLLVVVQALVLLELLREVGLLRLQLPPDPGALIPNDGLARGSAAPEFALADARSGRTITEQSLRAPLPTLLLFLTPRCQSCRVLASGLGDFADSVKDEAQVIAFCGARPADCVAFAEEFALDIPVLADPEQIVFRKYRAARTPSAVLVGGDGRIRLQGIPNEVGHLEGLLREEGTVQAGLQWLPTSSEETAPQTADSVITLAAAHDTKF